jgi:hypothetical protein
MSLTWPAKDPDEKLDYVLNWAARLGTDTISASAWVSTPSGLTLSDAAFTNTTATIWIESGEAGKIYKVSNRITTAGGRIMEETVNISLL